MAFETSVKVSAVAAKEGRVAAALLDRSLGEYFSDVLMSAARSDIAREMARRQGGGGCEPSREGGSTPVAEAEAEAEVGVGVVSKAVSPRGGNGGTKGEKRHRASKAEVEARTARIVELRAAGMSCRAISKELNVGLGTVSGALKSAKVPTPSEEALR